MRDRQDIGGGFATRRGRLRHAIEGHRRFDDKPRLLLFAVGAGMPAGVGR